jgi:hypothetical protein
MSVRLLKMRRQIGFRDRMSLTLLLEPEFTNVIEAGLKLVFWPNYGLGLFTNGIAFATGIFMSFLQNHLIKEGTSCV